MNQGAIYRKSALGTEAIASRNRELTPRLRSLLILIDGKRASTELAHLTGQADAAPMLDQLLEAGLIEEAPQARPVPPSPVPHSPVPSSPAPASVQGDVASAGQTVPLAQAQRFVVKRLNDLLGPNADSMCMKLEATRTPADFMNLMTRVDEMVRDLRGDRAADEFARDFESHRPA